MRRGTVVLVLPVLLLAGCTGQLPGDTGPGNVSVNETAGKVAYSPGETIAVTKRDGSRFNMTLQDYRRVETYERRKGDGWATAEPGERFLFLKIHAVNTGNTTAAPPGVTINRSLRQPLEPPRPVWMDDGWYSTDSLSPGRERTGWKL
ncbi:MAG: hypothetical protein SVU32_03320 [Candidatus Nanohaloarchaea archaeon]|nr:hypothetical protein [Candidatus Nanohaloarchaea archaeon]